MPVARVMELRSVAPFVAFFAAAIVLLSLNAAVGAVILAAGAILGIPYLVLTRSR